ncbi:MAG: ABC-three component system protein [Candidatus Thiodiazotropha sp.]
MPEELVFHSVCGPDHSDADIVFIHGLTGDPEETWKSEGTGEFWPEWLCDAIPNAAVHSLGYPASLFGKWAKKEMNLYERAANVLEAMVGRGIGERPLVFVCHSLGGILAKQIIRTASDSDDKDWKLIASSLRMVVFLATPHKGSSLASVLDAFVPHFSSKHVDLLTDDSGALTELNQHYRNFANGNSEFKTVVFVETFKTKKAAIVVPNDSADPGVQGTQPIPVDKDHINISKPTDKEDVVYVSLERRIRKILPKATGNGSTGFPADDYGEQSEDDRRDLLQKLIDAGRQHEYSNANRYQNKFARNYAKLGLYTEERERNDSLLSEVEQHFMTHIYHPLICKGASDGKVQDALQEKVINPIWSRHQHVRDFSHKTVLAALYFLTEQCYIRWDPEQ